MKTLVFDKNFEILQDVLKNAEERGITKPEFNPINFAIMHNISEFEPLPRLAHLQLVYEKNPYYGRHLRFYNQAPWWYRLRFTVPADMPSNAVLRIGAADYYADVWLNGKKLGSHEGYFRSFEFPVSNLNRKGENVLLIKVDSPWDEEICSGGNEPRCVRITRHMIKGNYEHADSFGSRDLNPVGLWKPVEIDFYDSDRIADVLVSTELTDGSTGTVSATVKLDKGIGNVRMTIKDRLTGEILLTREGRDSFCEMLENITPWTSYERGEGGLYEAVFELTENGTVTQKVSRTIGFRRIRLLRTPEKTELYLNGERFFVRGTSYLPEFIPSAIEPRKVRQDLLNMIRLGINTVRVHVHVEIPEFYEMCDELGLLVMQDSDLNWTFDPSDGFLPRVLDVWEQMLTLLGHHPCIVLWGAINEPNSELLDRYLNVLPGPQMAEMAEKLTPGIPVIRGSGTNDDPNTGDSHNYGGSLAGGHYLNGDYRSAEKFNTEFGTDCPPVYRNLVTMPDLMDAFRFTPEKYEEIANYQCRLIKYFIEDYRIRKYSHVAGYMQFLYSDPLPQTFYGMVDHWGTPKPSFDVMEMSGQKFCAVLEHDTVAKALWAVNDTLQAVTGTLEVIVTDADGKTHYRRTVPAEMPPDSSTRIADFTEVTEGSRVVLLLRDSEGKLLNRNVYDNPLVHPAHPHGHPFFINSEIGMPLYRTE